MLRAHLGSLLIPLLSIALAPPAAADPPGGGRTWVEHRVLPGERLSEIAARYAVDEEAILRDNGLPRRSLRAGGTLRVHAVRVPAPRKRIEYIVRFGDNWTSIAERHGVTRQALRRWNPEQPRSFAAGARLTIWVDGDYAPPPPTGLGLDREATGLSLQPVAMGGESAGQPTRGRLIKGVQLPDNGSLYTIRRPAFAFGSSHAVLNLQLGIAKFRQRAGYLGPLVVSDMSLYRGGRYARHESHQSGRDVDLWLPLRAEVLVERGVNSDARPQDFRQLAAARPGDIDWKASWELVKALLRTGEVQYIFISRARQRHLYRAARADGLSVQEVGEIIQYPRRAQTAVVRHSPGHDKHMHVRFRCADWERRCR
ncbi:MAG: penicillin-insensitive murein endopeptidase [Myxococcales bacterium]|nr:penicillin-insensitive murein endopeptidase [Myxococcales bacterium]